MIYPGFHLAQVNVAKMRAPLDDPLMADFAARIREINALAELSPGFIWRPGPSDDTSYQTGFGDPASLYNLSVWDSIESLRDYVYHSAHRELLGQRGRWFHETDLPTLALWWVAVGHRPTVTESRERLEYLQRHGESPFAFSFRESFPPS